MFLLDTNVISELRRNDRANGNVLNWAQALPVEQFFLSVISLLELERGALQIARKDDLQGRMLRDWIDNQILDRFGNRILPVDSAIVLRCARLHIPDPCSEWDALIAATALVHGLTVVTRNESDFLPTGVALINPWRR